jgi:DNA invertase Pin-like site-specific DNA recombinase
MVFARARRLASRDRTGRNTDCPQRRSSPYIRKVQHTVLSVAGLKGTMSEAELHVLRARLQGGILNKARRGELFMRPPIGFAYDALGRLVLAQLPQLRE